MSKAISRSVDAAGTDTGGPSRRPNVAFGPVSPEPCAALGGEAGVVDVVCQGFATQVPQRFTVLQPAGSAGALTASKLSDSNVCSDTTTPVGSENSTKVGATPAAAT